MQTAEWRESNAKHGANVWKEIIGSCKKNTKHNSEQTAYGGCGDDLILQAKCGLVHESRHHAQLDVLHADHLRCHSSAMIQSHRVTTYSLLAASTVLQDQLLHVGVDVLGALRHVD